MPAILKGWADCLFPMGRVYGGGKWYDNGVFKGKRAMLLLTTGGPEPRYSETGRRGLQPAPDRPPGTAGVGGPCRDHVDDSRRGQNQHADNQVKPPKTQRPKNAPLQSALAYRPASPLIFARPIGRFGPTRNDVASTRMSP